MKTVIICPGNGCSDIRNSNWYGEMHRELTEKHAVPCICENFPDPSRARRDRWVPFIRSLAERRENPADAILVGHSSGAQAALRYAERYPFHACVLVSATYTDLGDAHERASGYYPQTTRSEGGKVSETDPYLFEEMTKNCPNWHQFHSDDDPFIPLHEAERIRDGLGLTAEGGNYHVLPGRSHFFRYSSEILNAVLSLC